MTVMFWPVVIFMALSLAVGLYTYTQVRGSGERFAVCEKSMPFMVIGTALLAQAVDGNATLGNTALTFSSGVWAGLAIPLGLALSLFVVGKFLAGPLNGMNLLSLPEFFFHRYSKATEGLVSVLTVVCFTIVIAGNLSAVAWILSVVSGLSYGTSLVIATAVILSYTIAGGLYSAIWTDVFQIHVALIGFVAAAVWLLWTQGWSTIAAAVPVERLSLSGLTSLQAGALPNWAGIISLGLGNAMALDFMERVFAAKSPEVAKRSCYYAGALTLVIGGCATLLGLAAVGTLNSVSDSRMVLATYGLGHLPYWMAVMVFIGVLGASMSTANGAMLVISVVLSRNIFQRWTNREISDRKMLSLSRWMALPTAIAGACVAYFRPEPGILLVVAFDIVFAGCVVPLFFGVYWKKATSAGAIASILTGTFARFIAFFVTPAEWSGLDTLIPPVISLVAFYVTCSLTWQGVSAGSQITAPSSTVDRVLANPVDA
jgi:SSS family solute:Na+ symporter